MPIATQRAVGARRAKARRSHAPLRDQIRDADRDLFAREGYESVSMRRIGSKIGCSPMAIYRHYENKEELL
ncbi:MAG TPA: helix-turn-helix domain-containing protein, partial [Candidatus Angelobacter sp.]